MSALDFATAASWLGDATGRGPQGWSDLTDLWIWVQEALILLGCILFPILVMRQRNRSRGGQPLLDQGGSAYEAPPINGTEMTSNPASHAEAPPRARRRPRQYYLDALKIFLTLSVVTFHVACQFNGNEWGGPAWHVGFNITATLVNNPGGALVYDGGDRKPTLHFFLQLFIALNDAYFMALFFFISGLFMPTSLDKKGPVVFLADKFRRLGVPFLFFNHVLGPIWRHAIQAKMLGLRRPWTSDASSTASMLLHYVTGPPWFAAWLCTFAVAYAALSDDGRPDPLVVHCPRIPVLLFFGAAIGYLQALLPAEDLIGMPHGTKSAATYFIFFVGGILAKRGGWLATLTSLPRAYVWNLRAFTIILVAFFCTAGNITSQENPQAGSAFQANVALGIFGVVISLVEIDFFARHFQAKPGRLQKMLASSAYCVYIIHPLFLSVFQYLYVVVIRAAGVGVTAEPPMTLVAYLTALPTSVNRLNVQGQTNFMFMNIPFNDAAEKTLWGGFFFVLVGVHLTVWPVAYAIKTGFDRVPWLQRIL